MRIAAILIILSTGWILVQGRSRQQQHSFSKAAFYSVMASGSADSVTYQLRVLKDAVIAGKEAYEGALLMKKAGLIPNARNKLNLFKEGRRKLEASLGRDTTNTELRFLRLMIQENAPGVVHYNKELDRDSKFIIKHFGGLPQAVQKVVINYSKRSKVLSAALLERYI
ncbi:MAG: hypothetical protein H7Y03_06595 [Chitinophagaceae bacterium]|nr:hypothetical protein [Chitinophagaceae bacterium]